MLALHVDTNKMHQETTTHDCSRYGNCREVSAVAGGNRTSRTGMEKDSVLLDATHDPHVCDVEIPSICGKTIHDYLPEEAADKKTGEDETLMYGV